MCAKLPLLPQLTCVVLCCAQRTARRCVPGTALTVLARIAPGPVLPRFVPHMSRRLLPHHHCLHPV